MKVTLDLTSYIEQLRRANGFHSSEFAKYAHYIAGLMPQLRRVSAPALRLKADKHPFVFKQEMLSDENLGYAIVD